jgi:transposase, IS5 family
MALKPTQFSREPDLFRQELVNIIDARHPLVKLGNYINRQACEARFGSLYASGVGGPTHPVRLMVGLQLLKQTFNCSDEIAVNTWIENPYWQHFCGEQYFRHEFPIDPSLMTGFRSVSAQKAVSLFLA